MRRVILTCLVPLLVPALLFGASAAVAQRETHAETAVVSATDLAALAAKRFPQPVRVGDLIHRDVIQPVESQNVLGTVRQVVRDHDGTVVVVINYGGFLGFDTRPIAVPIDAMVLEGQDMEVEAFTPKQLNAFPTFSDGGTTPVPPDTIIKVGLAGPSH